MTLFSPGSSAATQSSGATFIIAYPNKSSSTCSRVYVLPSQNSLCNPGVKEKSARVVAAGESFRTSNSGRKCNETGGLFLRV